jgi:hypothetical protein
MTEGRSNPIPSHAVLMERDGQFFLYEPDIGVIASGTTADEAHRKFTAAKRAYVEEIQRAGLSVSPIERRSDAVSFRQDFRSELKLFAAKIAMVLVLLAAVCLFLVQGVAGAGEQLVRIVTAVGTISMNDVAGKAEIIVKDVQAMPPERKEALRRSLATLSREIDPFVEAWRNPAASIGTIPPTPERLR